MINKQKEIIKMLIIIIVVITLCLMIAYDLLINQEKVKELESEIEELESEIENLDKKTKEMSQVHIQICDKRIITI